MWKVPQIPGNWGPVDLDTPQEARFKNDYITGNQWQLVFSDEFNTEGRTFYPGDDPYWEAVNLHYWQTNNLEWYDPAAITTKNGALEITLSRKETHGLNFQSGMMSTWNKFCFTGGLIEASVSLPGINNIVGLWPAVWTMGNLGRAGYGASLEGMVCIERLCTIIQADCVFFSGLILMMNATLGLHQIKPSTDFHWRPRSTEIRRRTVYCHSCRVSVCQDVHVPENHILDRYIKKMVRTLVDRHRRSMFLRRRYEHFIILLIRSECLFI